MEWLRGTLDTIAASTGPVDLGGFLQYGAVGLIAALGVSFFFLAWKDQKERADRNESRYDQMVDKVIPVLLETASAARQNMDLLKDVQDKIVPILGELERQKRDYRGRQ